MRRLNKKHWPYLISVKTDPEVYEIWLEENMGPMRGRWTVAGYGLQISYYYFRSSEDAVMFSLRWS